MLPRPLTSLRDDADGIPTPATAIVTRAGLIIAGAALLYANGGLGAAGTDHHDTAVILITFVSYAFALVLLLLAIVRTRFNYNHLCIFIAVLVTLSSFYYTTFARNPRVYLTDVIAFTHVSAQMVLHGHNPYSVRDRNVIRQANIDTGGVAGMTNDAHGNLTDHLLVYPAGHLLPYVAITAIGIHDMRWLPAMSILGIVVLLWLAAPPILRPLAALPLLASPESVFIHPFSGVTDATWLLPLTCSAIALYAGRYNLAAAAFGYAAATKQQPWLLAPFLLIWLWQESRELQPSERLRLLARFAGISTAVFVLVNLPFMIWQFPDWLSSVLYPFTANLPVMGSGLSMLDQGVLSISKDAFTGISLIVFATLLVVYFRFYANLKHAMWIMPGIVFWFAHRSLTSYFVYWVPLLLVGVFAIWREQQSAPDELESLHVAEPALPV